MSNPTDFLLNTDYEMDKIVYFKSGDILPQSSSLKYIDRYDLGFIPLIIPVFSFSADFSDTRMLWEFTDDVIINLDATDSGIRLTYRNTNSNQRLYYRIYGFMPSDANVNVGGTQRDAKEFILNTDYNYCKIYKKGIASSDITINHNFGYTPLVIAWEEDYYPGSGLKAIYPCWLSGDEEPGSQWSIPSVEVTNTTIKIVGIPPSNTKVHYRIYYDEV